MKLEILWKMLNVICWIINIMLIIFVFGFISIKIHNVFQYKKWTKNLNKKKSRNLIHAAKNGQKNIVINLLDDQSANNAYIKNIALIKAASKGHVEIAKKLLNKGADIHASNDEALKRAAANGHPEVVKVLLIFGADVHADNDFALKFAALNGHTEVVELLLDRGADVHAGDDMALRHAAAGGHKEVAELLLDRGADVHAGNDEVLKYTGKYTLHRKDLTLFVVYRFMYHMKMLTQKTYLIK